MRSEKRSTREVVASLAGYLVFLIGLSLWFESLVLGFVFTAGSLFVIPYTRRLLAARIDVTIPQGILVVFVLTSLAVPSLVFEEHETGSYFGPEGDVTIRITYEGEWESEATSANSFRRRTGTGNRTYDVRDDTGRIEAFAEKTNGTDGSLTVAILVGDEVVATDTAGPGQRRASVEHRIGLLG